MIEYKKVEFGSPRYREMLRLREEILRAPLGLALSADDMAYDAQEWHLAALRGEELVGCLLVRPLSPVEAKLRQMAVVGSLRGQRIGEGLLRFAEEICAQSGVEQIVLSARCTALGFYEKCGYVCEGAEYIEQTIAHIKMRKAL